LEKNRQVILVEEEETDALCLKHQAGGYDTSCCEIAE